MTDHSMDLDVLARANPDRLKNFAESLIADLGQVDVRQSRTGLVMVPFRDTAQGTAFHLGEVLVSEAQISRGTTQGYGMRRGIDLEAAMAMALVDLCLTAGVRSDDCRAFIESESAALEAADRSRLCKIEATRIDMETF